MSDSKSFDDFWLSKGQKLVDNTITNLTTHIKNSIAYLNALSGFYLVAGVTAETLYKSSCIWIYVCYMLPVIFVQFLKFRVTAGQQIITNGFDLRSPIQIKDAHNQITKTLIDEVKKVKKKLFYATLVVVLGFSVAIYLTNLQVQKLEENKKKSIINMQKELSATKLAIDNKQKFKVTQIKGSIKIEAFLLEDRTLNITKANQKDSLKQEVIEFKIHKNSNYFLELNGNDYQINSVNLEEK